MAQASRRRKTGKKSKRQRNSGTSWGMLVIGLISGSVLAALLLGAQEGNEYGFGSGLKALFKQTTKAPDKTVEKQHAKSEQTPKPKLDFYTILPKIERIIPDDPTPPEKTLEIKEDKEEKKVWYVLQAASYANFNEADRLKAQLTISGFDATVQKVEIDKGVYFRVRLGPYASQRELKNVRQQLEELGIRGGLSLKVTEP